MLYGKAHLTERMVNKMNNRQEMQLTSHQLTTILIGAMLALKILSLPNIVVGVAKQDGWISAALGSVYPIYLFVICLIIAKKHPKDNILKLSTLYFGKLMGNILNLFFICYFSLIVTTLAASISTILRTYITFYLENSKILITLFLVPAFISYKGLKALGRMSEVLFYTTLPIFVILIAGLKEGTILNVMPVLGSGPVNIIKGVKTSLNSYSGMELMFLIYPFLNDKSKLKSCGIKSILFTTVMYTWITFITIYFLGIELTSKFLWSTITVSDSLNITFISSFRIITLNIWVFFILRTISIFYFGLSFGLSEVFSKISMKNCIYLIYPVCFCITLLYDSPTIYRTIVDKIWIPYIGFNIAYATSIAILSKLKEGARNVS